jgi:cytochrome P450
MLRWSKLSQHDNFHNHPFHGLPNADEIHQQADVAKEEMKNYVAALVPRRAMELQQHPERDDVLSRMLKCRFPSSLGFDGARMVINTIGTLIGAIETTSHAIAHIVDQLLNREAELSAAETAARTDDGDALSAITFEALRFNPISPYMYRLAVAEHTLAAGTAREHVVAPGQTVLALTLSAMFDDAVVPDASDFLRTGRPWSHYFHFGHGHHRCLGEHVAKAMMPEMIGRLVSKGHLRRASGSAGKIDYAGGPFPESFSVTFA